MLLRLWLTVLLAPLLAGGCGGTTLDIESLDEARDCGYAFSLMNRRETRSLTIRVDNVQSNGLPSSMDTPGRVPDEEWRGWIVIGSDLFAHNCQDEGPTDPEPVISERWEVVAGTLTIVSLTPADRGCLAEAKASDLVARTPDGEDVVLGDFELTNASWGRVPGLQSGASCRDQ